MKERILRILNFYTHSEGYQMHKRYQLGYFLQIAPCDSFEGEDQHSQYPSTSTSHSPYRRPVMTRSICSLVLRGSLLFVVGVFFTFVLNLLQIQRRIPVIPDVFESLFASAWWVAPICGTAAAMIGLLYPFCDERLGEPHKYRTEWSSVMRCVAVFVGINHASAKLDFSNNLHLSLTLAAMSIGLWWLFDRSRSGFGLGVLISLIATLVSQLLVYNGIYRYTEPDLLYVRSSLPCIFFSGGVTMGNIGRQLAISDYAEPKEHRD